MNPQIGPLTPPSERTPVTVDIEQRLPFRKAATTARQATRSFDPRSARLQHGRHESRFSAPASREHARGRHSG